MEYRQQVIQKKGVGYQKLLERIYVQHGAKKSVEQELNCKIIKLKKKLGQSEKQEKQIKSRQSSSESSSEITLSDMDDKQDPNFYRRDKTYYNLPPRVQAALRKSEERSKHSDFYYKLKNLNFKIHLYNRLFYNKVP